MKMKVFQSVSGAVNHLYITGDEKVLVDVGIYRGTKTYCGIRRDRTSAIVTKNAQIAVGRIYTNWAARQILADIIDTSAYNTTFLGFYTPIRGERYKLLVSTKIKNIPFNRIFEVNTDLIKNKPGYGIKFKISDEETYYFDLHPFIDYMLEFKREILNKKPNILLK